jgi:nitrite reductase (NADH) small subunit
MSDVSVHKWFLVAHINEVPLKEGKRVLYQNHEIAIFNLGNEYLAIDNQCPHKKGPLADGLVAGNAVYCPLHNWKIDLKTGCAISGGIGQVKTYPVKVMQNKIYVAFEEGKFQECVSSEIVNEAERLIE